MAARAKKKVEDQSKSSRLQLNDNIVTWLEENYCVTVSNGGRTECSVMLGSARLVFKDYSDCVIGKAIRKAFPSVRRIRSNSTYYYKHLLPKQDKGNKGLSERPRSTFSSLETVCQLKKDLICFSESEGIEGVSSKVYFARYEKISVAVKQFKEGTSIEKIKKELDALFVLGPHECLPVLLGICVENEPYCIIYKLYGSSTYKSTRSLSSAFSIVQPLTADLWVPFIIKLAESVDHIHKKGYVHGDLNEDHILVYKENYIFYPKFVGLGNIFKIEDSGPEEKELIALGKVLEKISDKFEKKYVLANKLITTITDPLNITQPNAAYIAERFKHLLDAGHFD